MKIFKTVDKGGNIKYMNEKGQFHREDGPSLENLSGTKLWYINGERHREDGPAVIFHNGYVEYYLFGNPYSKEEWELEVINIKLERLKYL